MKTKQNKAITKQNKANVKQNKTNTKHSKSLQSKACFTCGIDTPKFLYIDAHCI